MTAIHPADLQLELHDASPAMLNEKLMLAVADGLYDSTKIYLDFGADPNFIGDYLAQAPIHIAARKERLSILKLLVARGADVELRDATGRNATACAPPGSRARKTLEALGAPVREPLSEEVATKYRLLRARSEAQGGVARIPFKTVKKKAVKKGKKKR